MSSSCPGPTRALARDAPTTIPNHVWNLTLVGTSLAGVLEQNGNGCFLTSSLPSSTIALSKSHYNHNSPKEASNHDRPCRRATGELSPTSPPWKRRLR